MRKVNEEVRNGISPVAAFESFIQSCNTKETSKLASSIMQNLTKGNDEISAFLIARLNGSLLKNIDILFFITMLHLRIYRYANDSLLEDARSHAICS